MCPVEGVAAGVTSNLERYLLLAELCRVPEIVIDDSELRNLNNLPEVFRIRSVSLLKNLSGLGIALAMEMTTDGFLISRIEHRRPYDVGTNASALGCHSV